MRTVNVYSVLPEHLRLDPDAAALRVLQAYGALFTGTGSQEDADLVLVDLMQFTRYYDTANLAASPVELAAAAQRRAVAQRVLDALAKAGREPEGLLSAVLGAPEIDEEIEQ